MTDRLMLGPLDTREGQRSGVMATKDVWETVKLKAQQEGIKGVVFQKQEVFVILVKLDVSVVLK